MEVGASKATWIAFRSIVKRNLTTRAWPPPRRSLLQLLARPHPHVSRAPQYHPLSQNPLILGRSLSQDGRNEDGANKPDITPSKRKATRKAATDHSLRKVAVEAQRSRRGLIRGSGKLRHVDPEADTQDVTAYCAAESYNLSQARSDLNAQGFTIDPFRSGLFPQVLHVQTPANGAKQWETREDAVEIGGDIFVFPSGCVVTWNVPESVALRLVESSLSPATGETGHSDRMEVEDLEYIEDPSRDTSQIVGDTIILGTKASTEHALSSTDADGGIHNGHNHNNASISETNSSDIDTVLTKIAFSSALARSTKLAVLENSLSHYFSTTRNIPTTLSSGKPLRFTRSQILRKTGELLSIRAQLNLYSELTDALPDLFWDSPHELGLEGYYEMLGRALDVGVRIRLLNEKMDYASEIAAVLRERLSEKHGTGLEWMIIGLICIEVLFGIVHLWREGEKEETERRMREKWEKWLEVQMRR